MQRIPDNEPNSEIIMIIAQPHSMMVAGVLSHLRHYPKPIRPICIVKDAQSAFDLTREYYPEILLMDIHYQPFKSGLNIIEPLKRELENLKIMVVTSEHKPSIIQECLVKGADGFYLNGASGQELIEGLTAIRENRLFFSSNIPLSLIQSSFITNREYQHGNKTYAHTSGKGKATKNKPYIRLMVVDDHPVVLSHFYGLLNDKEPLIQCVGEASNFDEAIQRIDTLRPDVILTDLSMPKGNGFELAQYIMAHHPRIKVIIYTGFASDNAHQAYRLNIHGILDKMNPLETIVEAIHTVYTGQRYFEEQVIEDFKMFNTLSDRQQDVLQFLAQGLPQQEIAQKLGISRNSVSTHCRRILEKFNAEDTQALCEKSQMYFKNF